MRFVTSHFRSLFGNPNPNLLEMLKDGLLLKRMKKLLRKNQKEKRRLDWHDYTVSALYKFDKKVLIMSGDGKTDNNSTI